MAEPLKYAVFRPGIRRPTLSEAPETAFKRLGITANGFPSRVIVPCTLGDLDALVLNPATGRIVPQRQLLRAGQIVVPPPPVINWQSFPTIPAGSGDWMVPAGNYLSEDEDNPLVKLPRNRLVAIDGSRLKSKGRWDRGMIWAENFAGNLRLTNCLIDMIAPTTAGKTYPRAVAIDDFKNLHVEGNTFRHAGRGLYVAGYSTSGPKMFTGDANAGQGIYIGRNLFLGLDGRYWDGTEWRRSNWGVTQRGLDEYKATAGAIVGWDVANLLQANGACGTNILLEWNLLAVTELGSVWEDSVSLYAGSSARAVNPGYVRNNSLESGRRYDWLYDPETSTSYDSSGMILVGATSPQYDANPSAHRNSATALLVGDDINTSDYELNTSYINTEDNIFNGFRPIGSQQAGHHNNWRRNELYFSEYHHSGVQIKPGSYKDGYYQIQNFKGTTAAPKDDGTSEQIWGHNTFVDNLQYNASAGAAETSFVPADVLQNGGSASGNLKRAKVADGGAAAIAAFRQRAAAAGITLGSTLT